MNAIESALLKELTGGAEPKLLLRTRTRIDAGRWWRRTPVWLCVTATELILFAVARRRYTERVPLDACHASRYAHATGELVIDPTESLRIKRLSLTPREALDALDLLTKQSNNKLKP
jgi:hypothetical protein